MASTLPVGLDAFPPFPATSPKPSDTGDTSALASIFRDALGIFGVSEGTSAKITSLGGEIAGLLAEREAQERALELAEIRAQSSAQLASLQQQVALAQAQAEIALSSRPAGQDALSASVLSSLRPPPSSGENGVNIASLLPLLAIVGTVAVLRT